jgi:hypothetical protein
VTIRLFLLGDDVDVDDARQLLPVDDMSALLERSGSRVTCPVEVAPHGDEDTDWWVVSARSDARGRPLRADHVLGVGGASTTLAQLTVRRTVTSALDVGTGCGVQALHLSRHATRVTATDVVPRALALAAATFALSGASVELAGGDLVDEVDDQLFDQVVCNPPFVVGPSRQFAYRDSGGDADEMSRRAVRACASVLADGGVAQLLANWLHVRGEDWRDRVASWVTDLGCDAWLVQRDVQDPVGYVSTWSSDAGDYDETIAGEWLQWMRRHDVEGVGFGWVLLRRTTGPARVAVEEATQPVDQPLGGELASWLDRLDWLRERDDEALLEASLLAAPDLRHDVTSGASAEGWQPLGQALRLDSGWRWALPCDDATAAIVAGCDGQTPLRRLASVLAIALGEPEDVVRTAVAATARGLLDRGLLLPPPGA